MTQTLDALTTTRILEINSYLTDNQQSQIDVWTNNIAIGERLYLIKNQFNGNTKEFGDWLATHTPKLDVKLVSYYIKLAGHNDNQYSSQTIIDWLSANAVNATNPRSCWDKFNKAHKTTDETTENGEVQTIEPLSTNTEKDSVVTRLAQIYDEIKKRSDELTEDQLERVAVIASQLAELTTG